MINERMKRLGTERSAIRELFEYGNKLKERIGTENVFDFSLGNPSIPAPLEVNENLIQLIKDTPSVKLHAYTSQEGSASVRHSIAELIKEKHGVNASADYVYMTVGAAAALAAVLRAITTVGDEVIVLTPYFPEYRVFIESSGATVVEVPTQPSDFHPDIVKLKESITERTAAVIINSPNNPTGAVYTEREILEIGDLLAEKSALYGHPIYIISDEPYRELVYDGVEVPFIPSIYENTVVCYSYSKSLSLPGERIGYVFVNPAASFAPELFRAICGAGRALGYVCAPSLLQRLVAECKDLTADISEYRKNRDIMTKALSEYGFSLTVPHGAFYLFVKVPKCQELDFFEEAKARGILVVPSESFGTPGYFRLSYCVERNMILRSLPKFKEIANLFKEV